MEITLFEGARGTGKSTLTFKIRQLMSETTLINFTGFHQDGEEGLLKVSEYYNSWMSLLFSLSGHKSSLVFDRFYFSEYVFSSLYKEYDFNAHFEKYNEFLEDLSNMGVKINIFYLTLSDKNELKERLMRDKIPFGKVDESVSETLKQQEKYDGMFNYIEYMHTNENLKIHRIDTSGKSPDEVYDEVMKNLKPLN